MFNAEGDNNEENKRIKSYNIAYYGCYDAVLDYTNNSNGSDLYNKKQSQY